MIPGLRLFGLTGGIGSGKSTVARQIQARGIAVIDADQLARDAVLPGQPAWTDISNLWPDVVAADGNLDRRRLGEKVFADPAARRHLEQILHPRIVALSNQRVADLAATGHPLAFYEASLLVETGRHKDLDGLVFVDAPESVRIERVMARDGASENDVRARIAAQMPSEQKRKVADFTVENDGDLAHLERQVDDLLRRISDLGPTSTS